MPSQAEQDGLITFHNQNCKYKCHFIIVNKASHIEALIFGFITTIDG